MPDRAAFMVISLTFLVKLSMAGTLAGWAPLTGAAGVPSSFAIAWAIAAAATAALAFAAASWSDPAAAGFAVDVSCGFLAVEAVGRGTAGVILVRPLGPVGICLGTLGGPPGFCVSSKAAATLTSSAEGLDSTGGVGAGAAAAAAGWAGGCVKA